MADEYTVRVKPEDSGWWRWHVGKASGPLWNTWLQAFVDGSDDHCPSLWDAFEQAYACVRNDVNKDGGGVW